MWTGSPSAVARSWLSAVQIAQEKSRATAITAERAALSSVFDISRTMPSSRLESTERRTGSSASGACTGCVISKGLQNEVAAGAEPGARAGVDHDGGGRLLDDGGPLDDGAGAEVAPR